MNVSVNWLREMLPGLEAPAEAIADRLSMTAVAVDAVTPVGGELEDVRVARVLGVRPHPNADRLSMCRVDAGSEEVEVVCGAPVIEEGGLYPFVPAGGSLPGGLRIEAREIRGERSRGMLCSEHELRLGRDRSGILLLPPGLEPGAPLTEVLGLPDVRLTLDLTPNRVDLACHLGVARELAGMDGSGSAHPSPRVVEAPPWEPAWADGGEEAEAAGVPVRIEAPDRCRRYLGAVIRGVEVGPSPAWLAGRLRAVGLRPVNNVVDATNYVLLERNQPLHAFDLATLAGPEVRVRAAREGESLRTLDGQERELTARDTVIADRERPVGLAGVMGGEETEVTRETRDLFLECAAFDPLWVRRTARGQQLATDASYRFERGIDATALEAALARCVELVVAVAGGEPDPAAARVGAGPGEPRVVPLRPDRVRHLLGVDLPAPELRRLLLPLGFRPLDDAAGEAGGTADDATERARLAEGAGPGFLRFGVPGWRGDVEREVDLIEEVARRHGYDAFPDEPRRFRPSAVPEDPSWARAHRTRRLFAGRGFLEARSSPFVAERQPGGRAEVSVLNPLSAEEGHLRAGLVPVLLRRVEHNFARGRRDVRLFELGTTFGRAEPTGVSAAAGTGGGSPEGAGFHEEVRAAAVLTGRRAPRHWSGADADVDLWDLKGLAAEVAERLCGGQVVPRPTERGEGGPEAGEGAEGDLPLRAEWLAGAGFDIVAAGEAVGVAGRVADPAVDAPPWAGPVFALELRLEAVEREPAGVYVPLAPYPEVRRDLAITVPREVPAAELEGAIRAGAPSELESLELFDVYEGEGVERGRRSLAWSFRFRSARRTLTDEEVEEAMEAIVATLERDFGARVRAG